MCLHSLLSCSKLLKQIKLQKAKHTSIKGASQHRKTLPFFSAVTWPELDISHFPPRHTTHNFSAMAVLLCCDETLLQIPVSIYLEVSVRLLLLSLFFFFQTNLLT